MGSSWKLVLVFAVLFLMGGLSGSVITYSVLRKQAFPNPTRSFHTWTENLTQKIQRIGRLTPEQSAKIRPRIEAAVKQMTSKQTGEAVKEGYGLGWSTGGGTFGHGGAYATNMTIDPKHGMVTVFMVQHAGFPGDGGQSHGAFRKAAEERFGK